MKDLKNLEQVELSLIENIQGRIEKLISSSKKIDICSAWVTKSDVLDKIGIRMEELRPSINGVFLRIISGINFGGTDPEIFELGKREWKEYKGCFEIKIPNAELYEKIFHPKLYIFYDEVGGTRVLIGSMNFTKAGLLQNKELLVELKGKNEKLVNWFEETWKNSHEITLEERDRLGAQFAGNKLVNDGRDPDSTDMEDVGNWLMERKYLTDWKKYKDSLQKAAPNFNNFSRETILGDPRNDPWSNLFSLTAELLSSRRWKPVYGNVLAGNVFPYKFLGSLQARGGLCSVLVKDRNLEERKKIIKILKSFKEVNVDGLSVDEKADVVISFLKELDSLPEIGVASASRFLAITRQDLAFSYNGGSVRKLNLLGKLKGDYPTVKNYQKLLRLFYSTEWYNSKPPKAQTKERQIWNSRLALIDILVYEPE